MRGVRVVFGTILILGGAFLCGLALLESGGLHGWGELNPERLFSGKALPWTAGAIALPILGMVAARAGKSTLGLLLGVPLVLAAVAVGGYGLVVGGHRLEDGSVYYAASAGLALIGAIALASGRQ